MIMVNWIFKICLIFLCGFNGQVSANVTDNYKIHKVTEHVYIFSFLWDEINRSNIGVVIGEDGLLLINTMMLNKVDKLEASLKTISNKPVKYVLNSNYDWWSTSANKHFADKGAVILGHENTRYMYGSHTHILFDDKLRLDLGTEEVFIYQSGGHSYSHVNVKLKNANLIWLADSFSSQWPTILGPTGLVGYSQSLQSAMTLGDSQTRFVTGGSSSNKKIFNTQADLKGEIMVRNNFYNRTTELINLGKTNKEIAEDEKLNQLMRFYDNPNNWAIESWLINPVRFFNQQAQHIVSQVQLKNLVGRYQSDDGTEIEILSQNKTLIARANGWFISSLSPLSKSQFMFDQQHINRLINFTFDGQAKAYELSIYIEENDSHYLKPLIATSFKRI